MIKAKQIPLDFYQSPDSDLIIYFNDYKLHVYCDCCDGNEFEHTGQKGEIIFFDCWWFQQTAFEYSPYKIKCIDINIHSYILYVEDSPILSVMERKRTELYPNWRNINNKLYKHYVVLSQDVYVDVIAYAFESSAIREKKYIF